MLEQVFLNLFRNGIEAMEMDGLMTIAARRPEDDPAHILVEVHDNGCGMDEDDIPNVFNPFFTRKKYGTGLGMTHVKKIIDLHQGNVEIKSKKGEGTTVALSIPLDTTEKAVNVK